MKKITLISIFIFVLLFGLSVVFQNALISNKPLINQSAPLTATDIKPPKIDIVSIEKRLVKNKPGTMSPYEISKHNKRNDCYLVINNKVYDVTSYIDYHPGGAETIVSRCGMEVTGLFASIHSNRAWDLLKKFKVGTLAINKPVINTHEVLNTITQALADANPKAHIIRVSPKKDFYVAKVAYKGKLYEVHINRQGNIIKEEVENQEQNWSLWESDRDDKSSR